MLPPPFRSPAPSTREEVEIRAYRSGDEDAILALFNRVFAAAQPGFVPRGREEWRWQFLENPGGMRAMLALDSSGAVLAQYAGIGQLLTWRGRPLRASQSVDSMVDPARRSLARAGLFVRVGEAYAERFGGAREDRDAFMWGLPVRSALRIGRRSLGYGVVRTLAKLALDAAQTLGGQSRAVEEAGAFPPEVDLLTVQHAGEKALVAARDRAWLDWRYVRSPRHRYRIALAHEGGELAGCAVFRAGEFDGERAGLVCDWIVPSGREGAAGALRAWLARRAREEGCTRLVALFPDTSAEWLSFQRAGFRVRPARCVLAARGYRADLDLETLRKEWFFALGETDLV